MKKRIALGLLALSMAAHIKTARAASPVVLELFTSQGCSSCPPADEVLATFAHDSTVLPLSYHVNYWDGLSWKDPYSLRSSTARQYAYARVKGDDSVFTPQLMVNGTDSVIGSQDRAVRSAIAEAKKQPQPVTISLAPANGKLSLAVSGNGVVNADLWEVHFVTHTKTAVGGGENVGHTMESLNTVTDFTRLAVWPQDGSHFTVPPLSSTDDGVAIIAQTPGFGRILGSAVYMK